MKIRHSKITVELTEHLDKQAFFYTFDVTGVKPKELIFWLEKVLSDLKSDHTILYDKKEEANP